MLDHDADIHEAWTHANESYLFALRWKRESHDYFDGSYDEASAMVEERAAILREVIRAARADCPACHHDEIVEAELRNIQAGSR